MSYRATILYLYIWDSLFLLNINDIIPHRDAINNKKLRIFILSSHFFPYKVKYRDKELLIFIIYFADITFQRLITFYQISIALYLS